VTVTVVVADDQPLMRGALRSCLESDPEIKVVGEAVNGAEAVRIVERLAPDVVVMDIGMPKMDGIAATRHITDVPGEHPTRVLLITTFDTDDNIIEALRAGASGFVVKDAPPEEIIRAVRLLAAGEALLSPSVTRRLLDLRAAALEPVLTSDDEALSGITSRERTVLEHVARAMSNADIAVAMDLAPSSVKTHVGHLLAKLGFTDRAQLVVFAYEHQLVRPRVRPPRHEAVPTGSGPDAMHSRWFGQMR